jgi:hypothetical protein
MESWAVVLLAIATTVRSFFAWAADKEAAAKLDHIKKVGDDTHTLSNSAMGAALKAFSLSQKNCYLALKRISEMTKETTDITAAEAALNSWVAAERISGRHDAQQEQVDKNVGVPLIIPLTETIETEAQNSQSQP